MLIMMPLNTVIVAYLLVCISKSFAIFISDQFFMLTATVMTARYSYHHIWGCVEVMGLVSLINDMENMDHGMVDVCN